MAFCKNCGSDLQEGATVCQNCGTTVTAEVSSGYVNNSQDFSNAPSGKMNVGYLVWSILNILLCCMPLGIAGLVLTIMAQNKPTLEDEKKALKISMILNLIGTIVGFLFLVAIIVLVAAAPEFAKGFSEGFSSNY